MAAGDFDHIFGPNPFPPDDARHQHWIPVARYAAEEYARLMEEFLTRDLHDAATHVDFFADYFDIQAKWWMKLNIWDYQSAERFGQEVLPVLIERMLSGAKERATAANFRIEGWLTDIRLRLLQRSAHWNAEALQLARETEEKRKAGGPERPTAGQTEETIQAPLPAAPPLTTAVVNNDPPPSPSAATTEPETPARHNTEAGTPHEEPPERPGETANSHPNTTTDEPAVDESRGIPAARDAEHSATGPSPTASCSFKQAADGLWEVSYAGEQRVGLKHVEGMTLIRTLLTTPGRAFSATDLLQRSAQGERFTGVPTLDDQAKREVKLRLKELAAMRTDANERRDDEAIKRIEEEIVAIQDQFSADTGLAGRVRRMDSDKERDRSAASRQYQRARKLLKKTLPELADHLQRCISIGREFVYRPEKPMTWVT